MSCGGVVTALRFELPPRESMFEFQDNRSPEQRATAGIWYTAR